MIEELRKVIKKIIKEEERTKQTKKIIKKREVKINFVKFDKLSY